jgi:hypothetical protein
MGTVLEFSRPVKLGDRVRMGTNKAFIVYWITQIVGRSLIGVIEGDLSGQHRIITNNYKVASAPKGYKSPIVFVRHFDGTRIR